MPLPNTLCHTPSYSCVVRRRGFHDLGPQRLVPDESLAQLLGDQVGIRFVAAHKRPALLGFLVLDRVWLCVLTGLALD